MNLWVFLDFWDFFSKYSKSRGQNWWYFRKIIHFCPKWFKMAKIPKNSRSNISSFDLVPSILSTRLKRKWFSVIFMNLSVFLDFWDFFRKYSKKYPRKGPSSFLGYPKLTYFVYIFFPFFRWFFFFFNVKCSNSCSRKYLSLEFSLKRW